jgi:hypothetical protein
MQLQGRIMGMPRFTLKQLLLSVACCCMSLGMLNVAWFFATRNEFAPTVSFGLLGFAAAGVGTGLLWQEPGRGFIIATVIAIVLALTPLVFSP